MSVVVGLNVNEKRRSRLDGGPLLRWIVDGILLQPVDGSMGLVSHTVLDGPDALPRVALVTDQTGLRCPISRYGTRVSAADIFGRVISFRWSTEQQVQVGGLAVGA